MEHPLRAITLVGDGNGVRSKLVGALPSVCSLSLVRSTPVVGNMENKFFPESNTQARAPKIEGRPGSGSLLPSPPLHISAYHYLFINKDKEITLSS